MCNIVFYEMENGRCPVKEFLKSVYKQELKYSASMQTYLDALEMYGEKINNYHSNAIKHLEGDIWELRPYGNRVLFFFFQDKDHIVLLDGHKKSVKNKIVQRCIKGAQEKADIYKERNKL